MMCSVKDTVSLGQCLYFLLTSIRECGDFFKQKFLVFGTITAF
jgi:hypothetical protein